MLKLLHTTVADREQADRLARLLVARHLAACVQTAPIESTYQWQNAMEQHAEVLLMIKTTAERVAEVRKTLEREHPYEVPEIIVLNIEDASAPYAAWVHQQTDTRE